MLQSIFDLSTWVAPVLLAVTLHEAGHAYAAALCGDPTAREQGRLSLNPLRHVDPVGTILLPGFLLLVSPVTFGWAKPVPVDFRRLRSPRRDMVWVALAGPAVNVVLAIAAVLSLRWVAQIDDGLWQEWCAHVALNMLLFNLLLAVFNMIPFPPLDGGRVAVGLLPRPLADRLARCERFGMFLLIGLMAILPMVSGKLGYPLNPIGWLTGSIAGNVARWLLPLSGL